MRVIGSGGPAPVTPDDFMAAVHIDEVDDLPSLALLLASATEVVERAANRVIDTRELEITAPSSSWSRWWLPVAPVIRIDAVEVRDETGEWLAVPPSRYRLSRGFDEPQLVRHGTIFRGVECRVRVTAGHGADGGALSLKRAVILLAKEWHDADITATDMKPDTLSFGVQRLIRQARYRRPQEFA